MGSEMCIRDRDGLVSMRKQGGGEQATMTMEEFAQRVNAEVAEQLKVLEE